MTDNLETKIKELISRDKEDLQKKPKYTLLNNIMDTLGDASYNLKRGVRHFFTDFDMAKQIGTWIGKTGIIGTTAYTHFVIMNDNYQELITYLKKQASSSADLKDYYQYIGDGLGSSTFNGIIVGAGAFLVGATATVVGKWDTNYSFSSNKNFVSWKSKKYLTGFAISEIGSISGSLIGYFSDGTIDSMQNGAYIGGGVGIVATTLMILRD